MHVDDAGPDVLVNVGEAGQAAEYRMKLNE